MSPFVAKYGQTIDPQSAHEIITGRIRAAQAAPAAAAVEAARQAGMPPTTATGMNTMTPAAQRREIQRQAREMAAAQREADRLRRAQQREAAAEARHRERMMETGVRTAGRVLTSRGGQSVLRGIFGTLFGGGR